MIRNYLLVSHVPSDLSPVQISATHIQSETDMATRTKKMPPEEGGQILSINSLRGGAAQVLEINKALLNGEPIEVGKYPDFQDVIDEALKFDRKEDRSNYF